MQGVSLYSRNRSFLLFHMILISRDLQVYMYCNIVVVGKVIVEFMHGIAVFRNNLELSHFFMGCCYGWFVSCYLLGIDFKLKTVTVAEKRIRLQIW